MSNEAAGVSKSGFDSFSPESHGYKLGKSLITIIDSWDKHQKDGIPLCNNIADHLYREITINLESTVARLSMSVSEMKILVDNMYLISNQLHAISKLDKLPNPLFKSWLSDKLAMEVEDIFNMFANETNLKSFIGENIAHCRDENLLEIYKSAWEFNTQLNEVKVELLKKEVM